MEVQKQIPLAPFTTFKIGGPADFFFVAHSSKELIDATIWAKEKNIPFFVLGKGANILVGDKGFRGLVIKNESSQFSVHDSLLTTESGVTIEELINFTVEKGLSGFEHFAGIPSSVGGALWQNLHFLSPNRSSTVFIGDIVLEAKLLEIKSQNAKIKTIDQSYFQFGYDYSILHDTKDVVLSATFHLTVEDPKILRERVEANLLWRKEKHPENATTCSAGSVFKKLEGHGAGRLIEKVGLKGKQIGGAKVSEKHANFIINTGTATATDVRALIDLVQTTIKKELGFSLETEISLIGEF